MLVRPSFLPFSEGTRNINGSLSAIFRKFKNMKEKIALFIVIAWFFAMAVAIVGLATTLPSSVDNKNIESLETEITNSVGEFKTVRE